MLTQTRIFRHLQILSDIQRGVEVSSQRAEHSRDFSNISYSILASSFICCNPQIREIYSSVSW